MSCPSAATSLGNLLVSGTFCLMHNLRALRRHPSPVPGAAPSLPPVLDGSWKGHGSSPAVPSLVTRGYPRPPGLNSSPTMTVPGMLCGARGQWRRQWPRLVEPWALPVLRHLLWPLPSGFSAGSFGLGFISGAAESLLLEPGFGPLSPAYKKPCPGFPAPCQFSPCPRRHDTDTGARVTPVGDADTDCHPSPPCAAPPHPRPRSRVVVWAAGFAGPLGVQATSPLGPRYAVSLGHLCFWYLGWSLVVSFPDPSRSALAWLVSLRFPL